MENTGMPMLGAKFPTLEVTTTHGALTLPEDYKGKWFVLFSHPSDFTPVCTTEFVGFAQAQEEFDELNTKLVGLSIDGVTSHLKWVEWIKENIGVDVKFPIIADELGRTAFKLGMVHDAVGTSTVRSVFIVDDKGVLRLIMYYPMDVARSIAEILRAVRGLQMADINEVVIPENWPNNKILGDAVLYKPAKTVEDALKQKERIEKDGGTYVDWWYSYKKLDK